ncbi:MAG: citrate lyase holo-[acyl-carrier protein] synthase [Acholeplasmataceae bacterium]|nr:citrate lyase holo-[acyl-carrier protein] synthase [Acholeplasmataceae bacterium]
MTSNILEAREQRVLKISQLHQSNYITICVKANIPGMNKNLSEAHFLVRLFSLLIKKHYPCELIKHFESADGPYSIIQIKSSDSLKMKQELVLIEDTHPLGRFIDLDLYAHNDFSISRNSLNMPHRKCYICGKDAHVCSRTQAHSTTTLIEFIKNKVKVYLTYQMERHIYDALIKELELEDKFGLVTKSSRGSHPDMDYKLMKDAMFAILPYLVDLFIIGYEATNLNTLLEQSRPIGIIAEAEMLKATHGVNAYKGLIFILGLTILSSGYALRHNQQFESIFENIKEMSQTVLEEFKQTPKTAGLKAYQNHQITGIRGEAYQGLPSVISALKIYHDEQEQTLRKVLKHLILVSDDTVLLKRAKSIERYHQIKEKLQHVDLDDPIELKAFNAYAIKENLSFGGSADLLIVTIFLKSIQNEYFK